MCAALAAVCSCNPSMMAGMTGHTDPTQDAAIRAQAQTQAAPRVADLASISSTAAVTDPESLSNPTAQAVIKESQDTEDVAGYLAKAGAKRPIGDMNHPGDETLLNAKAAEYSELSGFMLDHLYAAIRAQQNDETIARMRLPNEIKPTIITATLDKSGKLRELVIEERSGRSDLDRMFIAACKQGLWLSAVEPGALTAEGVYKVRIQARMENFRTMDGTHWAFTTHLGLGLL
ncbi:MAG TPA: hypothetical protein VEJ86_01205 [Candidatus Binataceae bacterium]|nr:hypothetical protein [Candidatus Binataceae bacterium]